MFLTIMVQLQYRPIGAGRGGQLEVVVRSHGPHPALCNVDTPAGEARAGVGPGAALPRPTSSCSWSTALWDFQDSWRESQLL